MRMMAGVYEAMDLSAKCPISDSEGTSGVIVIPRKFAWFKKHALSQCPEKEPATTYCVSASSQTAVTGPMTSSPTLQSYARHLADDKQCDHPDVTVAVSEVDSQVVGSTKRGPNSIPVLELEHLSPKSVPQIQQRYQQLTSPVVGHPVNIQLPLASVPHAYYTPAHDAQNQQTDNAAMGNRQEWTSAKSKECILANEESFPAFSLSQTDDLRKFYQQDHIELLFSQKSHGNASAQKQFEPPSEHSSLTNKHKHEQELHNNRDDDDDYDDDDDASSTSAVAGSGGILDGHVTSGTSSPGNSSVGSAKSTATGALAAADDELTARFNEYTRGLTSENCSTEAELPPIRHFNSKTAPYLFRSPVMKAAMAAVSALSTASVGSSSSSKSGTATSNSPTRDSHACDDADNDEVFPVNGNGVCRSPQLPKASFNVDVVQPEVGSRLAPSLSSGVEHFDGIPSPQSLLYRSKFISMSPPQLFPQCLPQTIQRAENGNQRYRVMEGSVLPLKSPSPDVSPFMDWASDSITIRKPENFDRETTSLMMTKLTGSTPSPAKKMAMAVGERNGNENLIPAGLVRNCHSASAVAGMTTLATVASSTVDKDEAYRERRRKNNEAAKRSRDFRRQKERDVANRAARLAEENVRLHAQIQVLRNEIKSLQILLMNSCNGSMFTPKTGAHINGSNVATADGNN